MLTKFTPHSHPAATPTRQHDPALVKQAKRLVSQTFFGTILKQMHNSPFKSKILDGGRGGEVFSSMLDQHLTERMANGVGSKLVNQIVDHIERNNQRSGVEKPNPNRPLFKSSGYSQKPEDRRPHVPSGLRA